MTRENSNEMAEEKNSPKNEDLTDSPSDIERLRPEQTSIDLPDVNDIPGQKGVHVPPLGELADTTASSADEEDILNGDTLEGDPEEDNNETIGIP